VAKGGGAVWWRVARGRGGKWMGGVVGTREARRRLPAHARGGLERFEARRAGTRIDPCGAERL
jgi:hypothetical protein